MKFFWCTLLGVLYAFQTSWATTYTVINTNNDGAGSLRQAILDANNNSASAPHTINFAIPGTGPFIISQSTALPALTSQITINGFSQGGNGVYTIIIDGSNLQGGGLEVDPSGVRSVLQGLVIRNCSIAININASDCQVLDNILYSYASTGINIQNLARINIKRNIIGTDEAGQVDKVTGPGVPSGISISSSSDVVVGGNDVNDGNLMCGNSRGILIQDCIRTTIKGNKIGTNLQGTLPIGNTEAGILIYGTNSNLIIGGIGPGEGNLISGNIKGIWGYYASGIEIIGNKFGLDASGNFMDGSANGVYLDGCSSVKIGGATSGEGNLIVSSVAITANGSTNLIIKGNTIRNSYQGVVFLNTSESFIGGDQPGEGNIITSTDKIYGINISKSSGIGSRNLIQGNLITGFNKAININVNTQESGNDSKAAPSISPTSYFEKGTNSYHVLGKSEAGNRIDVYLSDGIPQNAIKYLGSTIADMKGDWTFTAYNSQYNTYCVATATDINPTADGSPKNNTSELGGMTTITISCPSCISSFAPLPGKKYVLSAWVKESGSTTAVNYSQSNITLEFPGTGVTLEPFIPTGKIIDGWQRIEGEFEVPFGSTEVKVNLINTGSTNAYFDDVRIHPFDGHLKSFVYDPISQRLVAELDENNYATFYEYDEEGALIRVKKETERGIMTIKETRGNLHK